MAAKTISDPASQLNEAFALRVGFGLLAGDARAELTDFALRVTARLPVA
jgi:hypothetical protein